MRWFHGILAFILLLSACSAPTSQKTSQPSAPVVLATTTFLADIARNVAGDRVTVESLLPFGADPHSYQPIPADIVKISKSTMLIVNGLDYEQFLAPLLENAGGNRLIITASDGLEPRKMEEGGNP